MRLELEGGVCAAPDRGVTPGQGPADHAQSCMPTQTLQMNDHKRFPDN